MSQITKKLYCYVLGCKITEDNNSDNLDFYRISPSVKETWCNALCKDPKKCEEEYICSKHFKKTDFAIGKVSRKFILKPGAVPSEKLDYVKVGNEYVSIDLKKIQKINVEEGLDGGPPQKKLKVSLVRGEKDITNNEYVQIVNVKRIDRNSKEKGVIQIYSVPQKELERSVPREKDPLSLDDSQDTPEIIEYKNEPLSLTNEVFLQKETPKNVYQTRKRDSCGSVLKLLVNNDLQKKLTILKPILRVKSLDKSNNTGKSVQFIEEDQSTQNTSQQSLLESALMDSIQKTARVRLQDILKTNRNTFEIQKSASTPIKPTLVKKTPSIIKTPIRSVTQNIKKSQESPKLLYKIQPKQAIGTILLENEKSAPKASRSTPILLQEPPKLIYKTQPKQANVRISMPVLHQNKSYQKIGEKEKEFSLTQPTQTIRTPVLLQNQKSLSNVSKSVPILLQNQPNQNIGEKEKAIKPLTGIQTKQPNQTTTSTSLQTTTSTSQTATSGTTKSYKSVTSKNSDTLSTLEKNRNILNKILKDRKETKEENALNDIINSFEDPLTKEKIDIIYHSKGSNSQNIDLNKNVANAIAQNVDSSDQYILIKPGKLHSITQEKIQFCIAILTDKYDLKDKRLQSCKRCEENGILDRIPQFVNKPLLQPTNQNSNTQQTKTVQQKSNKSLLDQQNLPNEYVLCDHLYQSPNPNQKEYSGQVETLERRLKDQTNFVKLARTKIKKLHTKIEQLENVIDSQYDILDKL